MPSTEISRACFENCWSVAFGAVVGKQKPIPHNDQTNLPNTLLWSFSLLGETIPPTMASPLLFSSTKLLTILSPYNLPSVLVPLFIFYIFAFVTDPQPEILP